MPELTATQQKRFNKAISMLPPGYYYSLCDEAEPPKYFANTIWGVYVGNENISDDTLGYVGKNGQGWVNCWQLQKKVISLLNRASAALWHKQPQWCSTIGTPKENGNEG